MKGFLMVLCGSFAGVIGGMGMGGGTILIPLLTIFLSISQHQAQGINLISFIPMSLVALYFHLKNKLIHKQKIWLIIVPSLIFAVGGSFLAKAVNGEVLKRIFGFFLLVLAGFQFFAKN